MGLSVWSFLRPAPGQLEPVALRAVNAFAFDGGALQADAEGYVRRVDVMVRLEQRRAIEVVRIDFVQDRALADGRLDPDHRAAVMGAIGDALSGRILGTKSVAGVVPAQHRFAERRLGHLSRWKPSAKEVEILRDLVNRKARRPLL